MVEFEENEYVGERNCEKDQLCSAKSTKGKLKESKCEKSVRKLNINTGGKPKESAKTSSNNIMERNESIQL